MYNILKHAHSGLRWVVLVLLIAAVVNAILNMKGEKGFQPKDKKTGAFCLDLHPCTVDTGLYSLFHQSLCDICRGLYERFDFAVLLRGAY